MMYGSAVQKIKQPEPKTFEPFQLNPELVVNLREKPHQQRLQMIVKLANSNLTAEAPEYDGGSWHIEEQLVSLAYFLVNTTLTPTENEHVYTTAIYYYSSDNITESRLSFRQRAHMENMSEVSYEKTVMSS
jgi:hypothetical protein